jgi:plasmid stabilization system protein ParE
LKWSPEAVSDVQRLYRFLASKNPNAATRAVRAIRASVRILAEQPEAGRPTNPTDMELREWLIDFGRDGYIALYRFDGDTVVVLAVRHGREAGFA